MSANLFTCSLDSIFSALPQYPKLCWDTELLLLLSMLWSLTGSRFRYRWSIYLVLVIDFDSLPNQHIDWNITLYGFLGLSSCLVWASYSHSHHLLCYSAPVHVQSSFFVEWNGPVFPSWPNGMGWKWDRVFCFFFQASWHTKQKKKVVWKSVHYLGPYNASRLSSQQLEQVG